VLLCSLRATVAKFNIIITIGNVAIANALPPAARPVLFSFNYDAVPKFDVAEPLDLELKQHFECHALRLRTKFGRNRIIHG